MEKDLCNQLYLFGMEEVSDLQSQNIICLRVNQSQKLGCSPDIVIEEQNQFELDSEKDNQLKLCC